MPLRSSLIESAAVVTGASSGIGAATALLLASSAAPRPVESVLARWGRHAVLDRDEPVPLSDGNLFEPACGTPRMERERRTSPPTTGSAPWPTPAS